MSHHLSGFGISPTSMDARTHITDLYAFQKPGDASKTILILDVNPLSPITEDAVDHESVYEIDVDTNGDAVADRMFRVRFSPVEDRTQTATVQLAVGHDAIGDLNAGEVIVEDGPVTFGSEPEVTTAGEFEFFAGIRSDPFFADFAGAANGFQWTGEDYFAEKNVFGIVLEVPNSALGPDRQVGFWGRVLVPHDGQLVQGDRIGRPAIDFVFNESEDDKRTWNQQEPAEDRDRCLDKFAHVFEHAGYASDQARELAGNLLPDILTFDCSSSEGYLNGRKLTDDVINMGIAMLTNGAVPHDGLRPHTDLLADFPYLGNPH
jgi:hypothetical protein